jgi:multiple sugar transport system permease protein
MSARGAVAILVRYVLAIAVLVVFLFPLYWLGITALKTPDEILSYPPVWWPRSPQLASFVALFEDGGLGPIVNSLIVATASTLLAVTLGTASAYAVARASFGGWLFAGWALAGRFVPPIMIAVPFVLVLSGMGKVASLGALILLYAAFNLPYVLWMMRGYFCEVPVALEEQAMVAGLTREEALIRVAWPMVRGGLLATAAFTFLLAWNELVFALALTPEAGATLPAQLARFGDDPELWSRTAALGAVGTLPVLLALVLMQRRLVRSLSFGFVRD